MPGSSSVLRYLGIPNGLIIVFCIASISVFVVLSFIGHNCMYPVNKSTANSAAL